MHQDLLIRHFQALILVLFVTACSSAVKAPVSSPSGGRPVATRSGSSKPSYHVVNKGDTLYSIAWRFGMDFKDVAAWNDIKPPYVIYPGQKIRLTSTHRTRQAAGSGNRESRRTQDSAGQKKTDTTARTQTQQAAPAKKIYWRWPADGKLVKLNLPTSENGLNISGEVGQEVKAAASGEVVYSGSGLLGYGKLIIIKHNETYLSAYAHNDRILIKEGMKVTIGQKIATMGIGNNGKPLLHFEIRKNGKPVDPIKFLPAHRS